jgi:branched-subunit amino acid aminotransferase/4-amino-4-deoxychorismate lyase
MFYNRAFKYGDALFETIRISEGRFLYAEAHFNRLSLGLSLLKMQNDSTPLTFSDFQKIIVDYIKTKSDANLRVRITFFRKSGGLYTPQMNDFDYFIESSTLNSSLFELNKTGLKIGICDSVRLSIDKLSNLKTTSALPYVMAAIEKKDNNWDDCLILNSKNFVAESIAANIFMVKDNMLITPSLAEGCVMGVQRKNVIHLAEEMNLRVIEKSITVNDLKTGDEIFLTNAIKGIQWVSEIHGQYKKFRNHMALSLVEKLN